MITNLINSIWICQLFFGFFLKNLTSLRSGKEYRGEALVCQTKNTAYPFEHKQPPYCAPARSAYLSPKKARENNSLFFEIVFRRMLIGSYMPLPYLQPYGLPLTTMPFFDKSFG